MDGLFNQFFQVRPSYKQRSPFLVYVRKQSSCWRTRTLKGPAEPETVRWGREKHCIPPATRTCQGSILCTPEISRPWKGKNVISYQVRPLCGWVRWRYFNTKWRIKSPFFMIYLSKYFGVRDYTSLTKINIFPFLICTNNNNNWSHPHLLRK